MLAICIIPVNICILRQYNSGYCGRINIRQNHERAHYAAVGDNRKKNFLIDRTKIVRLHQISPHQTSQSLTHNPESLCVSLLMRSCRKQHKGKKTLNHYH